VIHLAAAKSGDVYTQYAGTVVATENLLRAMGEAGVRRIVLVSSFAVYDYRRMWSWSRMDEGAPLQDPIPPRDAYSHTKRVQEDLVREAAAAGGWDYAVLRPGAIYGPDNIWTARLGFSATPTRWRRIGWFSRLPLTYVENCAEAIVLAAEQPGPMALTLNIVDDDPPTQRRYCAEVFRRLRPPPRRTVVPLTAVRAAAHAAALANKLLFRGRARLPAVLVPAQLDARFKPLRFSNAAAVSRLGWQPRYSLQQALDRSIGPVPTEGAPGPTAVPERRP
jgi:nucleoside-diphosphate-sugar epimerase